MSDGEQQADALRRATESLTADDLAWMMPAASELPPELAGFRELRDTVLDNATMAAHGFPGQTEGSIAAIGRITGHIREVGPQELIDPEEGDVVLAGMVAHLFQDEANVARWIDEVFLTEFKANAGIESLLFAEELEARGFYGKSAAMFAVHGTPTTEIGSTVVDFGVGRVLGVAFVVAMGRSRNLPLATDLALRLERRIVSVALGSA